LTAAITSVGAVTGHGPGVATLVEALLAGRTAVRVSAKFAGKCLCSELAAEGPSDATLLEAGAPLAPWSSPDRATRLLLAAAAEALAGRALEPSPRRGVVVGTTKGALELTLQAWKDGRAAEVDPIAAPAAALAQAVKALGPVRSIGAACASSSAALGEALRLIEDGVCDEVVVGGTEALHPFVYDGFHALKAISPEPAAPFDAHRLGLSLGEGAGVVVLESEEWGRRSRRATLASLAGYGSACDAHDLTAPEPKGIGLEAACRTALAGASIEPGDIGCYHAHGTATLQNDAMEAAMCKRVFSSRVPVTAIKGSIGHTLGAAGILDAVACIACMSRAVVPPIANLVELDREMEIAVVKEKPIEVRPTWALVATAGFGGINTALVFRYEPRN
jgi:3-oxoacyl-[acyl-carrier-protein] synthase II